jgi:YegS/Rv2252/BmrU family lipid kinase
MTSLSGLADNGKLWYGVAALLAASGKRRQRTAAAAGLLGMGFASALVNGPLKFLWQRDRPTTAVLGAGGTLLPLPRTYSFPSGHSASAFAFATGSSLALPAAARAVVPLAVAVAYSRVHTGVHFPSDVLAGSAIGAAAGLTASRIVVRARESSVQPCTAAPLDVRVPRRAVLLRSARSGAAAKLDEARDELTARGVEVLRELDIEEADRLRALLDEAGDDPPLVLAAGGDGTTGSAANIVAGTSALLAVLPMGTSNDVARSLGIPPDPVEAVAALVDGEAIAVDAGRAELDDGTSRLFLNAATAGLNVAFAKIATSGSVRDTFGGLTYPVSAALALRRYAPFECTIEDDRGSRTMSIVHLSISNATVFGGVLGMRVPGADISDGLLDVIAIEALPAAQLALAVAGTAIGRHTPVRHVHSSQVRALSVRAAAGQEVAVDGEVIGELSARFTALPDAVHVVVPRRS